MRTLSPCEHWPCFLLCAVCLAEQNIMEMSMDSAHVFDHRVSRSRSAVAPAGRCACAAAHAVHRKHTAPASAPPPFATSRRLFPAAFVERASLHIGCAAAHPLTGDGVAAARVLADCAHAEAPPRDRAGRLCRRERHVPIFCTFVPYSGYAAPHRESLRALANRTALGHYSARVKAHRRK